MKPGKELAHALSEGFNVGNWLEAEQSIKQAAPQPKGSLTVEQYSKMRGLSLSRGQSILGILCKSGHAKRERWHDGMSGTRMVYWLKPKKDWPK